jgi:hypothetical protein
MKQSNTRRKFISLVGGGTVTIALAQHSAPASAASYPAKAVEAWNPIASNTEIRRWMLAHGLLAPNPHNRQPWIADLRKDGEITLICDGDRLLPETDPFGRQILIGCGAFIELAIIAAAEKGFAVKVELFPNGEPALNQLPKGAVFARLILGATGSANRDALYTSIVKRHTNKGNYDNSKTISVADWNSLSASASSTGQIGNFVADNERRAAIKTITRDSYEIELTTPRTYLESAKLFRIGSSEIETHRDGISITGTMPFILSKIGMFDRFEVPVKGSSNYKRTMERWLPFETGSGYLWMASNGNSRKQQVEIGRGYVRAHLKATALGIDMHPLSQAVQEFVEVKTLNLALHRVLGLDSQKQTLQMLARVGYGSVPAEGSPRRSLDNGMLLPSVRS